MDFTIEGLLVGLLALAIGLAFAFYGFKLFLILLPIWGFFAGFAFGAGLVADFSDERFLGTVLGWVLGLVFALVFAILAYLYYYVAIVIAMGAAGFAIGSGIVVALGIDWNWVAVLAGLVLGILVGLVSVLADIPMIMLVVIGAIAGAVGVVGGLMLLFGSLNTADFSRGDFTDTVSNNFLWWLLFVVLVLGGVVIQVRQRALMRQSVREVWYAEAS